MSDMASLVNKIIKFTTDPYFRFKIMSSYGFLKGMPDEEYIKRQYQYITGLKLNLDNPQRFNEKLNWLKLYYRKPVFTTMVDKYAVKDYLKPIIGERHIVPLLGVWNHFDEIDFDRLPAKFVLKTTHGSGGIFICRDKKTFDYKEAKRRLDRALGRNYYYSSREWPYKDVIPRIIAEEYMQDGDTLNLNVYKVFCFSGEPALIQTIQNDKTKDETIDYFDTSWNLQELRQNFPNSKHPLSKPKTLDEILRLSRLCSKGFPFLRTDWYEINGEVYFSEFTFFTDAGYQPFYPDEWDIKLGKLVTLPLDENVFAR